VRDCFCTITNVSTPLEHERDAIIDILLRGGMIAPLLGGGLLMMDRSIPVYASIITFTVAGLCVLMLTEGEGDSGRGKAEPLVVH
jgi:hypothetical protein